MTLTSLFVWFDLAGIHPIITNNGIMDVFDAVMDHKCILDNILLYVLRKSSLCVNALCLTNSMGISLNVVPKEDDQAALKAEMVNAEFELVQIHRCQGYEEYSIGFPSPHR